MAEISRIVQTTNWTMNLYEKILANKLQRFYLIKENYDALISIKGKQNTNKNIALSTLFNNLATLRQNNIVLDGLYTDFYSQFEKDYFDIFARGSRVFINNITREIYPSNGDDVLQNQGNVQTTLCQLNFMFFLISNNLLRDLIVLQPPKNTNKIQIKQELLLVFKPTFLKI